MMNDIQPRLPDEEEKRVNEERVTVPEIVKRIHLPIGGGTFLQMIVAGLVGGGLMFGLVNHFGTSTTSQETTVEPTTEGQMAILPGVEDESLIRLVEQRSAAVVSIVISKEIKQAPSFGGLPFFFPFNNQAPQGEAAGEAKKQQVGSGSGFIVTADGLIVTNKHVVSDEEATYTVVQSGGKEFPATVLARDPNNDVAILKIEGSGFPVLPLGDSDAIKVGQTAIAIGNPLGEFANSVSRGIISGIKRDVTAGSGFGQEERLTNIIQTDAAINPGNSGGPLFDINGRVIGVNVAVAQGAENIGFALPVNDIKRSIAQVQEHGRIITPYIGVRYALLNEKSAKALGLPYSYGALILRGQNITDFAVIPGSPADKAGLVENDIILEINGKKVDETNPMSKMLAQMEVGQEVTLLVWHKGETKEIKTTIEEKK
jgi:serine protease Do